MRWWLRSRRPSIALLATAGFVVLVVGWGGHVVPTPGLLESIVSPVPLSVYVPLAAVIGATFSLSNSPPDIEDGAVRRISWLDTAFVLALLAIAIAGCTGAWLFWKNDVPLEGVRNLAGYLGLASFGLATAGPISGPLFPSAFAIFASTFGFRPGAQALHWWAWPLASFEDIGALSIAAVCLVAGLSTLALRGRRRSGERDA